MLRLSKGQPAPFEGILFEILDVRYIIHWLGNATPDRERKLGYSRATIHHITEMYSDLVDAMGDFIPCQKKAGKIRRKEG